jgi:uncharacterized protein YrrD
MILNFRLGNERTMSKGFTDMQEMPPTIKKWSELQGLAAVSINNGKKAGTIEDFYFDIQNSDVKALLIKTGLVGHRALLTSSITAIGQQALTFTDENFLIKESNDPDLPKMPLGRALVSYRVLTEGGNVVGTIGNIILDISTPAKLRIAEFELAGGLFSHLSGNFPTFKANQIIRYGHDVIIVSDAAVESLQKR